MVRIRTGRSRQLGPKATRLAVTGMGLLFFLAGGGTTAVGVLNVINAGRSLDWPTVEGVIERSDVETHHRSRKGGSSTTYHAAIEYAYTVNGTAYSGGRVSFGDYGSSFRGHAQGICDKYPVGMTVTVHYNPDDPDTAALEPGRSWSTFFLPGLGSVFTLIGLGLLVGSFFVRTRRATAKPSREEEASSAAPRSTDAPRGDANPYRDGTPS